MDEHALILERERAHQAKLIMENPLIGEYFETFADELVKGWKKAKTSELREDYWRYTNVLSQFRKHFEQCITTGKMAEMSLAEMQEKGNG